MPSQGVVRPFIMYQHSIETAKHVITLFSPLGRHTILIFSYQMVWQYSDRTGAVFLDLTAAYDTVWHIGLLYKLSKSMPYWFTRLVGLLLRDRRFRVHMGNDTSAWRSQRNALPQGSVLHRFCSTCTPTTCQLHVAENSFTLTTYVSPFKANTSANWNAVFRQIWRGYHTSVNSGDLNQAPPKQSAVCSTCIIPALPVNCQFIWMASAFGMSAIQPILGWL